MKDQFSLFVHNLGRERGDGGSGQLHCAAIINHKDAIKSIKYRRDMFARASRIRKLGEYRIQDSERVRIGS
jgi:hypothetical protein